MHLTCWKGFIRPRDQWSTKRRSQWQWCTLSQCLIFNCYLMLQKSSIQTYSDISGRMPAKTSSNTHNKDVSITKKCYFFWGDDLLFRAHFFLFWPNLIMYIGLAVIFSDETDMLPQSGGARVSCNIVCFRRPTLLWPDGTCEDPPSMSPCLLLPCCIYRINETPQVVTC